MTAVPARRAHRRRQVILAAALFGLAAGMMGVAFASVPLYRLICQQIGLEGTPRTVDVAPAAGPTDRTITVRFDANVHSGLPWRFAPMQKEVVVHLGEQTLIHYEAENRSNQPVVGTATFNVVPAEAAMYFNKIECFCFSEQTLAPGQTVSMPVVFYIDPKITEDFEARSVTTVTLSYTFYRVAPEAARAVSAGG